MNTQHLTITIVEEEEENPTISSLGSDGWPMQEESRANGLKESLGKEVELLGGEDVSERSVEIEREREFCAMKVFFLYFGDLAGNQGKSA